MKELEKQYDSNKFEEEIYLKWEKAEAFKPSKKGEPYSIMLPPPNITGSLHMGHALGDTLMDILARYHRLRGKSVLWQPGMDSAALPTNKIIEEQLADEGKTRHDIGREKFIERADAWYKKTGSEILNQMKRLGASCDWDRSVFTMDEDYVGAINQAFMTYYEKGYIYRGSRIVNWDPKAQTTVSDLEIDYQTKKGKFYYFQYGPFEIGTARPETKFGDKYVVIHPDDDRYQEYKHGDTFECEWINGPITATVIKDEASDPKMGSGVMTITPWHSQVDFELAQKHDLDMEQIIDFEGKLLPVAQEFEGKTIEEAREQIVAKLEKKGLLNSIDEKYQHNVALNDRGKGVIEPQVMRQWFVDMSKLKDATIKVAKENKVSFSPARWKKHFIDWMENVYDWNINRQIWLGHRMPVWWKKGTHGTDDEEGNYVIALESPGDDYEQDPDTLDTWFSSALWPFATLGWPFDSAQGKPKYFEKFYPTSVLVTARDILYLWVARMIFSGLELVGNIPFNDVFIHATVLTKDGKRMSKSLGTGIDPLELIDEYGADALRFGLMGQMSYDSQAIKFSADDVKAGRNFANKLWNVARLVSSFDDRDEISVADEWIQSRLASTANEVAELIEAYKIGEAGQVLYSFIWRDYADWYLEVVKNEGSTKVARQVLVDILKILHPFMPHVTEVLWEHFAQEGLLMLSSWPELKGESKGTQEMTKFQDVVSTIRSARALLMIPAAAEIKLGINDPVLPQSLAKLAKAEIVDGGESMIAWPLAGGETIKIASDHITSDSISAAVESLKKEKDELAEKIAKQEQLLKNMTGRAPAEVVNEKKQELEALQSRTNAVDNILLYLNRK